MLWSREEFDDFWRKERHFNELRVKRAAKIAIAGLICTVLGLTFQLDRYNWMLVTVFVLMMPASVGGTLEKAVLRIMGTLTGALVGLVLISSLVQHHMLFTVCAFVYFGGCFYFGTGKVFAYSFMIAAITAVLVAVGSLDDPSNAINTAAERSLEIILGVIISSLVAAFIWPVYARDTLQTRLSQTSRDCAALLRRIGDSLLAGQDISRDILDQEDAIVSSFGTDFNLLHEAASEDSTFKAWSEDYTGLILQFESLLARLKSVRRSCGSGMTEGLHLLAREETAAYIEAVATRLDQLGEDITKGLAASRVGPVREAADRLGTRVEELRSEGLQFAYSSINNRHFTSFLIAMRQIVDGIEQAEGMIIAVQHHRGARPNLPAPTPLSQVFRPSTWAQIWVYDPLRFQHGVKAGLAFIILFFLTQTGFVPYAVETLVSATVILIVTNVGASGHKALLRLTGCFIGGSTAILAVVFYFPQFQGVIPMLLLSAFIFFTFGYIAIGDANYAYAGFQMAIAYFITAFDSFAPPDSILPPIGRMWGVIFGAGLSLLVLNTLWPVRAYLERRRIIASIVSRIARQLDGCVLGRPPEDASNREHQALHHTVLMQLQQAMSLCVSARFEAKDSVERNAAIASLIRATQALFFALVAVEEALDREMDPVTRDAAKPAYDAYRRELIAACDRFAAALASDVDRLESLDLSEVAAGIDRAQDEIRAHRLTIGLPISQVGPVYSALDRLEQMGFLLSRAVGYAYTAYGPHRERDATGDQWRPVTVQPLEPTPPTA